MKNLWRAWVCLAITCGALRVLAQGSLLPVPPQQAIRGATFPAISPDGSTLCFTWLGDLWLASTSGGAAHRLTVHPAHDGYARWSPDGKWILFASNRYAGASPSTLNYDLFLIPALGGEPRRLTTYTGNDYPADWAPDGKHIIFQSMRDASAWQVYSMDISTGVVKTLTHDEDELRFARYSPDGRSIAYDRSGEIATWSRPLYHGSANMDIYTQDLTTGRRHQITTYDGMDIWPLYASDGKRLFYVTDQLSPRVPNLVSVPLLGGRPTLITNYKSGGVRWPDAARNSSAMVFEHEGWLYALTAPGAEPRRLEITAASDEKQNNLVPLNLTSGATEMQISPDGRLIAFVARGEIWTVPVDGGGDAKRITNNIANDYEINWSPDAHTLAFASDRNGQFDIYTIDTINGALKQLTSDPNDETLPGWSPDGKTIAFLRSGPQSGLYIADAAGKSPPKMLTPAQGNNLFLEGINSYAWSPDSRWIAFSRRDPTRTLDVWITSAETGRAVNVTWYPGINYAPDWSMDGKDLLFLSDRDRQGAGTDLYALPLEKEHADLPEAVGRPATPGSAPPRVDIDFTHIEDRARRVTTVGAAAFAIAPDGRNVVFLSGAGGRPDYWMTSVQAGPLIRLTSTGAGGGAPQFPLLGSRFYTLASGGLLESFLTTGGPIGHITYSARLLLDRHAEVVQAFNEFWRRLNVGYYDPKMHGVNWAQVKARYQPLLAGVDTPEDFWYLLSEMVGELNSSHTEITPAAERVGFSTGELGLHFDENYGGNGIRVTGYLSGGPDDDLGPRVKPGEYIMQVDGTEVTWNEQFYNTLLDKAGKQVTLTVNSMPTLTGSRQVKLTAISRSQWTELVYTDQVETARAAVDTLSDGRLAYIRIKAMDPASLKELQRELWGKAREKEGLVLDIRGNPGGNTHDEILGQLARTAYAYTRDRDSVLATQPFKQWNRPIVLLINQNSVSDAEIFPDGFRALKLGTILGVPTPGYVIGTQDATLQDGTGYRVPLEGYYTLDGADMENRGVRPDIIVEQAEADSPGNHDRQLEAAVNLLLKHKAAKPTLPGLKP